MDGQPAADPAPGPCLSRGEGDRPATDVGVPASLVGAGVVPVVLSGPPPVAEPDQQVAMDPAEQVAGALGTGDLPVAGVVADEPRLGEHHGQEDCHQQLPPGGPQQEEHGPPGSEQDEVYADLDAVVPGTSA